MKKKLCGLLFLGIVTFGKMMAGASEPHLQAVTYKKGALQLLIEIESTQPPLWTQWAEMKNNISKNSALVYKTFFMPHASMAPGVQAELARLSNASGGVFSIECVSVQKPIPGLKLTLSYDSSVKEMLLKKFSPLDTRQGLVIILIDKRNMYQLLHTTTRILHYADNFKSDVQNIAFEGMLCV